VDERSATVVESDGYRWLVRDCTDDAIGPSDHEAPLLPELLALLPPGGVFVDVGAHVGRYAVRLAARCAQVVAVEPNPDAAVGLRRNLELNAITNVAVHEVAAYDSKRTLMLWDPYGRVAGGTTRTLPLGATASLPSDFRLDAAADTTVVTPERWQVVGAPLDSIDLAVPRIDLLKIDVEGAEAHVLRGARELLRRYRPAVWIELHHAMYGQRIWIETIAAIEAANYSWVVAARWCASQYVRAIAQ
jgi:FkbM family methyltransferase